MKTLLLGLLLAVGCSHEEPAPKLEPGEKQPLPPSSGTPIGFLIDDAGDLSLTPDQLAQLQGIDLGLQARLESLDKAAPRQPQPQGQQQPPMGGRHGRGGGGRHRQMQQQPQQAGSGSGAPQIAQQSNAKRAEVKDAIEKALAILDVPQRVLARKVLSDHDVDWDDAAAQKPALDGEAQEP